MTNRLTRAALAALLLVAAACGGGETNPPAPASITTTTAPAATATAGASAGVFAVRVSDESQTPLAGITVNFTVTGNGSVSPTSAMTNAGGIASTNVTAGSTPGSVTVFATVGASALRTEATVVVVSNDGAPCVLPSVGAITEYQGLSSACLNGGAAGSEYVMVAYNSSTTGSASATISGTGLTAPLVTSLVPSAPSLMLRGDAASRLVPDGRFHRDLQARTEALAPRFAAARGWRASLRAPSSDEGLTAAGSRASRSALGSNPTVGQVIRVNVNGNQSCTNGIFRGARIMAVGTRSVVLADTLNPPNGFTTADFERFAARFDTLVYPLDVATFGTPSDIDNNGRVGIVFTKAVNELTAKNSSSFVGGFFYSRDLFPKDSTAEFGPGCAGSNEGEMFYMLAPDPTGIAYQGSDGTASSSNIRRTGFVDSLTTGTIAHEFQHLINASRRIYVNTGATNYEITWLNEGLSHIAEELLYYRESGKQPRQNLNDNDIRVSSPETYPFWRQDAAQNFSRFVSYLRDPAASSPVLEDDDLAIRGAAWAFLRYAADRLYPADGDVWLRLANSTDRGFGTLRLTFGQDQVGLLKDWAVTNYLDDTGLSAEARFQHRSWNFRDIYARTFTSLGGYPLKVTVLTTGSSTNAVVVQNSAGYYRFAVAPATEGRITLNGNTTSGAPLQFVVIRTR